MSLLKMPNPQLEDVKRSANTIETEDEVEKRSSRSASKIANMSLLKMPNPQLEDVKRSANTIETDDEVEKRMKVKTTDTESPAKIVRVPKKQGLIQPSKLAARPGVDE